MKDKAQLLCDKCEIILNEDEIIETFDNEILCSPCYIKKEFHQKNEDVTDIKGVKDER